MKEKEIMDNKKLIIEGYQPVELVKDGHQPSATQKTGQDTPVTPLAEIKIIPPRGGTGETALKK
jgi:hypothetical protein